MTAWAEDEGTANGKITLLTEDIFWNAGYYEEAEAMKKHGREFERKVKGVEVSISQC